MSNVLPSDDLNKKTTTVESIQNLTFMGSRLMEQSDVMRVDICHYLIENLTQELEQWNNILLKLMDI